MSHDDRRRTGRQNHPIEIELWSDSTRHQGRIEDLSEGGAYIYTGLSWPSGKTLCFSFGLPGSETRVTGTGTVVWSEYMGFGLRFDVIDDDGLVEIRKLVGESSMPDRRGFSQRLEAASGG